jgi:signal peptidase II
MLTAPFVALVALEVDKVTKLVARESLPTGESIPLAAGFHLANVVNPGIVFGISAPTALYYLLPLVMIVVSLLLFWRFERSNSALLNVGIGLYVGGCLGNLVDRIVYGHATDLIAFTSSGSDAGWVFNLADVCVIVGILLIEVFLISFIVSVIRRKGLRYNPLLPYVKRLVQRRAPNGGGSGPGLTGTRDEEKDGR